MKVVNFGGSSLASASQIRKKVFKHRQKRFRASFVVVSAPGKRNAEILRLRMP